ncbi:MAG: transposase [Firmicutes bacterium]|nr:transposase [Bacillota bacterium]
MNYFRYDTHVHTSEVSPCGMVEASDMVRLYKMAGYQGIIITDHYFDGFIERPNCSWNEVVDLYLMGYRKALIVGLQEELDILLGMEIRFDGSSEDYLVYGFDEEFLYKNPYLNRLTIASFSGLIAGKDIMIFQAHPYRKGMTPADPNLLDGVEAFNGNPRHNSNNDKAFAFGKNNGLFLSSGSDAHQLEDIGRGGIGLTERMLSSHELVKWIKFDNPVDLIHRV